MFDIHYTKQCFPHSMRVSHEWTQVLIWEVFEDSSMFGPHVWAMCVFFGGDILYVVGLLVIFSCNAVM